MFMQLSRGSLREHRVNKGKTTRQTGHKPRSVVKALFCNGQRQAIVPQGRRTSPECEVKEARRMGIEASSNEDDTCAATRHFEHDNREASRHKHVV